MVIGRYSEPLRDIAKDGGGESNATKKCGGFSWKTPPPLTGVRKDGGDSSKASGLRTPGAAKKLRYAMPWSV